MKIENLHPWDVDGARARAIQEELRERIRLSDDLDPDRIGLVAGVDNAYTRDESEYTGHAAVVVLRFSDLEIVETVFASQPVRFPYIPGLLTFREAPAILDALRRLSSEPDVILFDGQGYAHPRRLGLAAHMGVILDRPTIGCAKTRLTGRYEEPADEWGASTPLVDRGEVVGAAVRTRPGHSPLFVSPGNHLSVESAVAIVLACCREHRFIPEPTRQAHNLVGQYKRERRRELP